MLPPVECLFAWLGEQVLVHLFGGSPMANSQRYPFLAMLIYHLKSLSLVVLPFKFKFISFLRFHTYKP